MLVALFVSPAEWLDAVGRPVRDYDLEADHY